MKTKILLCFLCLSLCTFSMSLAQEADSIEVPTRVALEQNYPNPFNPTTNIRYSLADEDYVLLTVYTIQGQRVATLVNSNQGAGDHNVTFNARTLPSGLYLYRLQTGNESITRKLMVLK